MTGVLLVTALLLLATALAVVPPLLGADRRFAPSSPTERRRAALESRREELYIALREAELDLNTGKLTEAEHAAERERLLGEVADGLRQADELADPTEGAARAERGPEKP